MKPLVAALVLALPACVVPWSTGSAGAASLSLGSVTSAINGTGALVNHLPTSVQSVSFVDVFPAVVPSDPYQPQDPYRSAYIGTVFHNVSSVLAFRNSLPDIQVVLVGCSDGCVPPTVGDMLAGAGISTNQVVAGRLSGPNALTVYYDSNPSICVTSPTDPYSPGAPYIPNDPYSQCVPPNPI